MYGVEVPFAWKVTGWFVPNARAGFADGGTHICLGSQARWVELRQLFYDMLTRLCEVTIRTPARLPSMFIHGIDRTPVALA